MIAIKEALAQVARNKPDLVIYNAGMDPINAGISRSTLAWREETVAEWREALDVPLVFALAGGYTWGSVSMDELVNLHRFTIRAFAERSLPNN
jgi:acetoin utilization deacetylase AcuC-like enzyme